MAETARSKEKAPAAPLAEGPDPRRWLAVWVVLAASFLALFDLFVVNVAAPSIEQGLHTTTAAVQLVIAGFSFTYALGLISGGRLGDQHGPRALFLAGMTIFGLSLLVCGVAPNAQVLIVARLGQGAGASLMVPQVLALIQILIPGPERPRAFAYFGATAGLGAVAGQALGGILLSANLFGWGWRGIFLIQLPIVVAALFAGRALLPGIAPGAASSRTFDGLGAFLFAAALAALLIPLTLGRQYGWPVWSIICLIAVVPLLALFVVQQYLRTRDGKSPLIALGLFSDRAFTLGLLINIAFYAELGSFFLIVTWFMQDGLRYSPLKAGLTFAALGVGFIIGSFFLARRLAAKYAHRLLVSGILLVLVTVGVGAAITGSNGVHTTIPELIPVLFFVGLGNGLVLPTLLNVVLAGVAKEHAGAASGVLVTMQQVGTAVGVAAIGSLYFTWLGGHSTSASFRDATSQTFLVDGLVVLLTGCLLALLSLRRTRGARDAQAR
jgi:MFS family permease